VRKVNWWKVARKRWPHGWVAGDGRFVYLAHCKRLTVELCSTLDDALACFEFGTTVPCSDQCSLDHEVAVLNETGTVVWLKEITEVDRERALLRRAAKRAGKNASGPIGDGASDEQS
jgi:hypothetical protein